jgi:hypothetical protein
MTKKCINDEKAYYVGNEPSPKGLGYCAHAEKIDSVMIGKNNKLWIIKETSNKSKKWIQLKGYFTINNGSHPFFVHVNSKEKQINIYKQKTNKFKFFKSIYYENIFIGKSSNKKIYDGNTILIEKSPKKFVFIGDIMYNFTIKDDVVKYYSPVENNQVPYPILLGSKNIYFMLDKKYVDLSTFPKKINFEQAYAYFYGYGSDKIQYSKYAKNM